MIYAEIWQNDAEPIKQELRRSGDSKWYRRMKIIDLSAQKKSVPELSSLSDVCLATVRDYIRRYNKNGLDGLRSGYGVGCPRKIPFSKEEWEDLLHRSPCGFEQLNTGSRNWTQKLLAKYFRLYHRITVSQPTISLTLKQSGLKWNRGWLKVTSPDPLYIVKRERIEALKKKPLKAH
ncbi:helix-turn-helix domain-containing protein [Desulfococcaceae bacterium HSG9]|nr:helix-turn-helix domain-containing protein [Desulfococcaceae bacterium HSG9]